MRSPVTLSSLHSILSPKFGRLQHHCPPFSLCGGNVAANKHVSERTFGLLGAYRGASACSAGKKDSYEVLVQGGVLEDLGRYLVQQYGVPKKYIEVRTAGSACQADGVPPCRVASLLALGFWFQVAYAGFLDSGFRFGVLGLPQGFCDLGYLGLL